MSSAETQIKTLIARFAKGCETHSRLGGVCRGAQVLPTYRRCLQCSRSATYGGPGLVRSLAAHCRAHKNAQEVPAELTLRVFSAARAGPDALYLLRRLTSCRSLVASLAALSTVCTAIRTLGRSNLNDSTCSPDTLAVRLQ